MYRVYVIVEIGHPIVVSFKYLDEYCLFVGEEHVFHTSYCCFQFDVCPCLIFSWGKI